MSPDGNIHLIEEFEDKVKTTNIETKEVKFHNKLPNLFKMIPPEDYTEVKAMDIEQRLEYYDQLVKASQS